jgi:[ribosomal protein S5]-alanine N-acetyltransferase
MDPPRTEVVFLVGKLVSLRPLEREDAPALVRWLNDPEVREGLQVLRPLNLAAEYAFLENLGSTQEKQVVVGIIERSSGALVGACGLHDISWTDRRAQFGIFIGEKSRWGQGLGREASQLLIGYAFGTLGLHRVELHVYAFNNRALRTYRALGFAHEGTLREHHFHDGRFVDTHTMAVLNNEWTHGRGAEPALGRERT